VPFSNLKQNSIIELDKIFFEASQFDLLRCKMPSSYILPHPASDRRRRGFLESKSFQQLADDVFFLYIFFFFLLEIGFDLCTLPCAVTAGARAAAAAADQHRLRLRRRHERKRLHFDVM